jgi:hypothetical protein
LRQSDYIATRVSGLGEYFKSRKVYYKPISLWHRGFEPPSLLGNWGVRFPILWYYLEDICKSHSIESHKSVELNANDDVIKIFIAAVEQVLKPENIVA